MSGEFLTRRSGDRSISSRNITRPAIKNRQKLLRFGIVGGINTALDFGLLFLFKSLGIPVEIANILSTGLAFIFSFFANKKYTFKTTDTNVAREITLFIIVTLAGLWVIQTVIIALTEGWLTHLLGNQDLGLLAAKLLATVASMTWNYILYDKVVFKKA